MIYGHFLRSGRKSDLKTCITPPKLKILNLNFFDLVMLDYLDLTQGPKRLRSILRSMPDKMQVIQIRYDASAPFQFDTAAFPGETINDR